MGKQLFSIAMLLMCLALYPMLMEFSRNMKSTPTTYNTKAVTPRSAKNMEEQKMYGIEVKEYIKSLPFNPEIQYTISYPDDLMNNREYTVYIIWDTEDGKRTITEVRIA